MRLAARLAGCSLGGKVYLCNSGAEANEAAIKLARKAKQAGDVVVVYGAFHGRTYGALSGTPQESKQAPFAPLVPGFRAVAPEPEALAGAVDERTAAVLLEPIQGESGVHVLSEACLQAARAACDAHGERSRERVRDDGGGARDHFAQEVRDKFDVEVCRVGRARRLVGVAEAEKVNGIRAEVAREREEVSTPHEGASARADAVDEEDRRSVLAPRVPVEDLPVFPRVRARLAAERARLRLRHVARDRGVHSRQRHARRAARDQSLPEFLELTHLKLSALSGQHSAFEEVK